jgi:hypothetical protein
MSDQANAVDPEAALLAALGDDPRPEDDAAPEDTPVTAEAETEAPAEETPAEEPAKYLITVKNEAGQDEEKEVSVDELAKGYMLQADYTRKTQEVSAQKQNLEAQYAKALQDQQAEAVSRISQLQELVLSQATPELNGVDWVALSVQDPARFVQLRAKQEQVNQTWQALEAQKSQHQQAQEQNLARLVDQALRQSEEVLSKAIPDFDGAKVEKLLTDVHKSIGWTAADIKSAARALAKEGMHPGTIGQVLLMAHKAIQFDAIQTAKPAALKKVAAAPKVIKPAAPQPRSVTRAATQRLQKTGRTEDLAALL